MCTQTAQFNDLLEYTILGFQDILGGSGEVGCRGWTARNKHLQDSDCNLGGMRS